MTPQETNQRIDEAFRDPRVIQAAIEKGIADALQEHARAGRLVPTWSGGKVIWVDPVTLVEVNQTKSPAALAGT